MDTDRKYFKSLFYCLVNISDIVCHLQRQGQEIQDNYRWGETIFKFKIRI